MTTITIPPRADVLPLTPALLDSVNTPQPLTAAVLTLYAQTTTDPQTGEALAWLQRALGHLPLPTPTPTLLRQWRAWLSTHLAPGEVNQCMDILTTVFTMALRAGAWAPGLDGAVWRRRWRMAQRHGNTVAQEGEQPL